MNVIEIKKGSINFINADRSTLINAEGTNDGVVFFFKNGFHVNYTDIYMPIHTKELIRNSTNSFPTADLSIDLANYNQPVLVTPTNIKK